LRTRRTGRPICAQNGSDLNVPGRIFRRCAEVFPMAPANADDSAATPRLGSAHDESGFRSAYKTGVQNRGQSRLSRTRPTRAVAAMLRRLKRVAAAAALQCDSPLCPGFWHEKLGSHPSRGRTRDGLVRLLIRYPSMPTEVLSTNRSIFEKLASFQRVFRISRPRRTRSKATRSSRSCAHSVRRLVAVVTSTLALTACSGDPEALLEFLFGRTTAAVILADHPVTVSTTPLTFALAEPAVILGTHSSLCMVIAHGVEGQEIQAAADRWLRSSTFEATVETTDKQSYRLSSPSVSGRMVGRLPGRDELAVCVRPGCGTSIPVGAKVQSVSVIAGSEVPVIGIYWESSKAFDRFESDAKKSTDGKSAAQDMPHTSGRCSSMK